MELVSSERVADETGAAAIIAVVDKIIITKTVAKTEPVLLFFCISWT